MHYRFALNNLTKSEKRVKVIIIRQSPEMNLFFKKRGSIRTKIDEQKWGRLRFTVSAVNAANNKSPAKQL